MEYIFLNNNFSRINIAGLRIIKEEILHKISNSTGGSDSLFSIYYYHRNRIYFIKKFTHDFKYVSSLFYFFITRSKLLFLYNTKQRSALKKAIFDGFRMKA